MAGDFDRKMALPENRNLAPPVSGFDDVPEHFSPVVYKFIQRAMVDVKNFDLNMVFTPEFAMVPKQPQTLVTQEATQENVDRMKQSSEEARVQTRQDLVAVRQDRVGHKY